MKDPQQVELEHQAYLIADACRTAKEAPGAVADRPVDWPDTWAGMRRDLERRCPGFTEVQYDRALELGFVHSR